MGTHRFPAESELPSTTAVLTVTTVDDGPERVRVALTGEIDMSAADGVGNAVVELLHRQPYRRLEVDLAEVRFMDSSGVNILVRCSARAEQLGCRLIVTNPRPIVHRVL